MVDKLTPERRSLNMQAIGQKDTKPELAVRKLLHALGYRFRLHRRDLPGRPDIVLAGRRKIILVHGCFWHGHECGVGRLPRSKLDYWGPKISGNRDRDRRNEAALAALGWGVLTVWECDVRRPDGLAERLTAFLGPSLQRKARKLVDDELGGVARRYRPVSHVDGTGGSATQHDSRE